MRRAPATPSGQAAAALCAALLGCSAARALRPLSPGETAVEVSVPGVWVESGGRAFPVGAPVLGVRRGVTPTSEVALRFDPGLLAVRVVGLQGAGTWHVRPASGLAPGIHLTGSLDLLVAPAHLRDGIGHAVRGALAVDATAHWEPAPWLRPYLVQQGAVVLATGQGLLSTFAGAQVQVSPRWDLSLETGLAGWNVDARRYTQHYLDVRGRGAVWLGGAITYRFGRIPPPAEAP